MMGLLMVRQALLLKEVEEEQALEVEVEEEEVWGVAEGGDKDLVQV